MDRYWGDRADSEETNADVLPELAWQNGIWKVSGNDTWLRNLTPSSFELNAAIFLPGAKSLQLARDGFAPGVNAAELPRFPQQPAKPVSDPAMSPLGNPTAATDGTKNGAASSVVLPTATSAAPTASTATTAPQPSDIPAPPTGQKPTGE